LWRRSADDHLGTDGIFLLASLAVTPYRATIARRQLTELAPDVQRCELLIQPDLGSGQLRVTATLDIANRSGESEFTFFLAAWYDSVAVGSHAVPPRSPVTASS
jgi:hypothetical protein